MFCPVVLSLSACSILSARCKRQTMPGVFGVFCFEGSGLSGYNKGAGIFGYLVESTEQRQQPAVGLGAKGQKISTTH